jgi:hypothetical protein
MAETRAFRMNEGDVLLMVGTVKGAFLLRSRRRRGSWDISGPHFPGRSVYAMAYDDRAGRRRVWAAASSMHWGAVLHSSEDFGRRWTDPQEANIRFPEATGVALKQIWQIQPGRIGEPETLYCGVEPSALFESKDAGATWSLVHGLWNHPHRPKWAPGGGGLCLHTILPDPHDSKRMLIATSTGGVYRTDDGGGTWSAQNKGIRTYFLPEKYPEFGQCVHKIARHPVHPARLFLQHHFGVYRSDDGGGSWKDVGKGLPSDFGFPIAVHPHEPDTIFVLPLKSDEFRCPPAGKLRVFRSKTAGGSWRPLWNGLPQRGSYESVLRDALAVDTLRPLGIYFGTRGGRLYATRDEGRAWTPIADGLPAIVCVKAATISREPSRSARRSKVA